MKKCLISLCCLFFIVSLTEAQEVATPLETAKTFTRQGDYANAVMVLNKALEQDGDNLELLKELGFTYYLQRDNSKAMSIASRLLEKKDADVQAYQIAAMPYKALDDLKELDKIYKKGLKAFPNSGVLHNEYGELLWGKQDFNAIKQWEKGIEVEPNYAGNYYNAAKYYYFTQEKVWGLMYGEIFVNMESYSRRTVEMKEILLNGYKKLFTDGDMKKNQDEKNGFVMAVLNVMSRNTPLTNKGITPETLVMLRTRFALQWNENYRSTYPFKLFEYHHQLLNEGMFEAYNHWLFGSAQDLTAFQGWTNSHTNEYNRFIAFQKGRVFKMPSNQYYNR